MSEPSASGSTAAGPSAAAGPLVSIVVPVRNEGPNLAALLRALERQTLAASQFEVIVADDGSTDGSTDGVLSEQLAVRVTRAPAQTVYAARNRAVTLSHSSYLAFVDGDCLPEPRWLERGVAALETSEVAAGLVLFSRPADRTIWALLDVDAYLDQRRAVRNNSAVTANLFVRRETFDRVGGFDPHTQAGSDYELVRACVEAGGRLVLAEDAVVYHPARNRARSFLGKVWSLNWWTGHDAARLGRRPMSCRLRYWIPVLPALNYRLRYRHSLGLDRERLAENGFHASVLDQALAVPVIYLLLPYLSLVADFSGWRSGRRDVRTQSRQAQAEPASAVSSSAGAAAPAAPAHVHDRERPQEASGRRV